MEYIAVAKNIKISPRKVRLVAEGVKHYDLQRALAALSLVNKRAARPVKKAIESAIANAVNTKQANKGELMIKEITVNEGISYKRYHFASRGRVRPYKKRTSHITVVLADSKTTVAATAPKVVTPVQGTQAGTEETTEKTAGAKALVSRVRSLSRGRKRKEEGSK